MEQKKNQNKNAKNEKNEKNGKQGKTCPPDHSTPEQSVRIDRDPRDRLYDF